MHTGGVHIEGVAMIQYSYVGVVKIIAYKTASCKSREVNEVLVTKKLDMYTDKENRPRSREYRLLSNPRHSGNPYRSKAGKAQDWSLSHNDTSEATGG